MLRAVVSSVLVVTLLAGAVPSARAQGCFGPDNLDIAGACCQPVLPNLPPFPAGGLGGLGICWNNCQVGTTNDLKVSWTPPLQVACAQYTSQITVADANTGLPVLSGNMVLDYTRTWDEVGVSGTLEQVWRFVAKVDLAPVPGNGAPCPVPPCLQPAGPYSGAFYYGYMDYSTCTAAGGWQNALVLFHNCDRFIHAPGFSSRPGQFHPGRSFAIVAPHSTAQPFVPANLLATGGPLVGEAARGVNTFGPAVCVNEDPVLAGAMTPLGAGCVCTLAINPKQQTLRQLQAQTQCPNTAGAPGGFASLNVNFPAIPWLHIVTTSIGTWTAAGLYPGAEAVWVDEGLFVHQDGCTGDWIDLKYGASTRGGWPAILPSGLPVAHFTDMADNWSAPVTGPYPLPINGNVFPTDRLVYVNEP